MKEELIVTLKTSNTPSDLLSFVTEINKGSILKAQVLPIQEGSNSIEINISKITE